MLQEFPLEPLAASVAEARRHARELLNADLPEARMSEVEVVISELVGNAVRHGPGRTITLRIGRDAKGRVLGEVEDQGNGTVAIRRQDVGTVVGGLGLPIVDALASDWGVYPGSTHVWFRFDL